MTMITNLYLKDNSPVARFDELYENVVRTGDLSSLEKRFVMLIKKKKDNKLPLTSQEEKILNQLEGEL